MATSSGFTGVIGIVSQIRPSDLWALAHVVYAIQMCPLKDIKQTCVHLLATE